MPIKYIRFIIDIMENKIAELLIKKHLTIATTESCTGGLLSSKLTDVSGSSNFVHLNFVTYSNNAKMKILNVSKETLENFGAVSEECSYEMAKGLYEATGADICVSTTGIAGPTGGTKDKPVGLMYSTIYTKDRFKTYKTQLSGDIERVKMKEEFVKIVLENIYSFLSFI